MPIDLKSQESAIRENRLGAITGYKGSVKDLAQKAGGCALKNRERCFSQTSSCSSGCAQGYLSGIQDAAIVNHAPLGCAADTIVANVTNLWGQYIREWEYSNINVINTNMTEEDTVFGGADKLREAVREAYRRFNPKAIFVTTSCVSGIIGEDLPGILDELDEEIPVPVIPVYCEGFRSKIWASGFDAAFHAILTRIVKPPEQKRSKVVNMINFRGSARDYIATLLGRLGLTPQFIVPFSTVEQLSGISEAAATISICGTLGGYLGTGLEEKYGVPYIKSIQPHGIAGINSWLRDLGRVVGKEEVVEKLIAEETVRITPKLEEIREKLKGKRVVVGMGPSFGLNYIRVLEELGLDVVWGAAWHFDQHYDYGESPQAVQLLAQAKKDIPISVCDQQNFEVISILKALKPDLYISRHGGTSVWANKLGVASLMVADEYSAFGHEGIVKFGQRILDLLTNRSFARSLAGRVKLPYTDWWFAQDTFKFLQEEVV